MPKFAFFFFALVVNSAQVRADIIVLDESIDISGFDWVQTWDLSTGPVQIAVGDSVDLTVRFRNGLLLEIENDTTGFEERFFPRLTHVFGQRESVFTAENIRLEFYGFQGSHNTPPVLFNPRETSGMIHVGARFQNFLSEDQFVRFSGFNLTFDLTAATVDPKQYAYFTMSGTASVVVVPEPSTLVMVAMLAPAAFLTRRRKRF